MNGALVLRGEDHIHEDHREEERPQELVEGAFQFAAAAGHTCRVAGRQVHLFDGFPNGLNAISERVTGGDRSAQADGSLAVKAIDARCVHGVDDAHQVVQPHEATAAAGNVKARERIGIVPKTFGESKLHIIDAVDRRIVKA